MKPVGIANVVAQSFASINVPEASTWAMMLFGFGRRTERSGSEKAETIGPISFAERNRLPRGEKIRGSQPGGRLLARVAVCRLAQFGAGRSIAFNLARAFNRLWLEIRLVL
jgi:hypothetical protein